MKDKQAVWQTNHFKEDHGRVTIVKEGYLLLPMTVIHCCYLVRYENGYLCLYETVRLCE